MVNCSRVCCGPCIVQDAVEAHGWGQVLSGTASLEREPCLSAAGRTGREWLGRRAGSRLLVLVGTEGCTLARALGVSPQAHRSPQRVSGLGGLGSIRADVQELC